MTLDYAISLTVNILLAPIYIAFFSVFMVLWMLSVLTGIGPLMQWRYKRLDDAILNRSNILAQHKDMQLVTVPGNLNSATKGKPYQMMIRYTKPAGAVKGHVCFPNGLGATMVILGKVQDELTEKGYAVLTFDRLGVGFSDDNPSGISPTAEDLVRECEFAMSSVEPVDIKWVLVGPSMGSIISQCFIACHPDRVKGFLNMDGLPYPFHVERKLFLSAGKIYGVYTNIIWTGVLRPFIALASKKSAKMFVSKTFPLEVARAQLNQSRFFGNIGVEMATMMNCCDFASKAWGPTDISKLDAESLDILARAMPNESVDIDEKTGVRTLTSERSESETGSSWSSKEQVASLIARIKVSGTAPNSYQNPETVVETPIAKESLNYPLISGSSSEQVHSLSEVWKQLVVSIMSARNHNFGSPVANSFYKDNMKAYAAAEHAIHALWAKDGFRTVYPKISHANIFGQSTEIVNHVEDIFSKLVE